MDTLGYALAMRVLQSDLYRQLDDLEAAECDELIRQGMEELKAEAKRQRAAAEVPCKDGVSRTVKR